MIECTVLMCVWYRLKGPLYVISCGVERVIVAIESVCVYAEDGV